MVHISTNLSSRNCLQHKMSWVQWNKPRNCLYRPKKTITAITTHKPTADSTSVCTGCEPEDGTLFKAVQWHRRHPKVRASFFGKFYFWYSTIVKVGNSAHATLLHEDVGMSFGIEFPHKPYVLTYASESSQTVCADVW